jgi:hypothetical protein
MNIANGKDFICRKDLKGLLFKKLTYIAARRKFFRKEKYLNVFDLYFLRPMILLSYNL